MALPNLTSFSSPTAAITASSTTLSQDDPNRKVRKQYTISKSRESWTEPEHDKFMEAIQLFDRDWKKIEAFIGSKSVIQIRSHAQKYFLKVEKTGIKEHLPPPRPKRKAVHPYPQKASKITAGVLQPTSSLQTSPAVPDTGSVSRPDTSASLRHSDTAASLPCFIDNSVKIDDVRSGGQSPPGIHGCCRNDSNPRVPTVLPDFAQVYSFIGSVFDPNVTGHLQKLKKMDRLTSKLDNYFQPMRLAKRTMPINSTILHNVVLHWSGPWLDATGIGLWEARQNPIFLSMCSFGWAVLMPSRVVHIHWTIKGERGLSVASFVVRTRGANK